jgi:hypothetical protein
MKMARVGVLLDKNAAERRWKYGINVFELYIEEILAQAGIPFQLLDNVDELTNASLDILVAGMTEENEETTSLLWKFAETGGTLISYAGLNSIAAKLGCELSGTVDCGYASMGAAYEKAESIRFMKARPWRIKAMDGGLEAETGTIHKERPDGAVLGSVLQRFTIGSGALVRWSVDIADTIVRLQQGNEPVLTDGVPAEDGTGALNDNVLKADDRSAMDWKWDRLQTETGAPYFAYPYADYWRELLIGQLLRTAVDKGMALPFIGYWPKGIRQVATISHDSDINQDIHADATLNILQECGIHSTWCMLEPGYSPHIYDRVKEAGHELAFHYNALDSQGGKWDEAEFGRQLEWLKSAATLDKVYSNKNHYTRFEGWSELFAWCEKYGVESDQTRGPSKKGNVGFLFGTCHPYFPIAWSNEKNRMHDVVEISFLTQDLDLAAVWADSSVIIPFLDRVKSVEGVAHFLFHQIHIEAKESVRIAFRKVVEEARKRDFVFWTGRQINDWHRARRKLDIVSLDGDGTALVRGGEQIEGAIVWIPVSDTYEAQHDDQLEVLFGLRCRKQAVTSQISV